MKRKSSINIQNINYDMFAHNHRDYTPSYALPEKFRQQNEYISFIGINEFSTKKKREYLQDFVDLINQKYTETTGRKPQKNRCIIKEAVINTDKHVNRQHFLELEKQLKQQFNLRILDISHHRDEGYVDRNGDPHINYHAHLVLLNADVETGKSLRLDKQQFRDIQTVVAQCLGMERGEDKRITKVVRYNHKEYKKYIKEVSDLKITVQKFKDLCLRKNDEKQTLRDEINTLKIENLHLLDKFKKRLDNANYSNKINNETLTFVSNQNDFYKHILGELGLSEFDLMQLQTQKTSAKDIAKELREKLEERYKNERNELKKSGEATQQQYMQLKLEFEQQKLVIKELKTEINKLKPKPQIQKLKNIEIDM